MVKELEQGLEKGFQHMNINIYNWENMDHVGPFQISQFKLQEDNFSYKNSARHYITVH